MYSHLFVVYTCIRLEREDFSEDIINKLFLTTLLAGCHQNEQPEEKEVNTVVAEPISAAISIKGNLVSNKEVDIETSLIQGTRPLDHVDEVKIEIRKAGEDERQLFDAENSGKGQYHLKHTFSEPGKYFLIAHITEQGQHIMPEKEIIISGS